MKVPTGTFFLLCIVKEILILQCYIIILGDSMQEKTRVVLIGANLDKNEHFLQSLLELASLADALNYEVVNSYSQNIKEINNGFYIGEGKAKEINNEIKNNNIDYVIFNNELSPLQISNLEKLFKMRVIDRTMLILDIFSLRAKTKEAKLQVELAALQYMMPRMLNANKDFDKQRGGNKNKGLGEKLLELDRRRIAKRINLLKKELIVIQKQQEITSKQRNRSNLPKICLVGYTNAGKSSLLNCLIELYGDNEDKKVYEKDMLFATLDTSTRKISINHKDILISDTVGFVSMLPHLLVESFKSTLQELKTADLLLNIIDQSSPNYLIEKEVTEKTIQEVLNGEIKPIINVYSKVDLPSNNIIEIEENEVFVSSKTREGIADLMNLIFSTLHPDISYYKLFIGYDHVQDYYKLEKHIFIEFKEENDTGIYLEAYCPKEYELLYKKYIIDERII